MSIRRIIMLLLRDILLAEKHTSGDVWLTDRERWGAMNTYRQVRYFRTEKRARQFARGIIKGPRIGRPQPKQHKQHPIPKIPYAK